MSATVNVDRRALLLMQRVIMARRSHRQALVDLAKALLGSGIDHAIAALERARIADVIVGYEIDPAIGRVRITPRACVDHVEVEVPWWERTW